MKISFSLLFLFAIGVSCSKNDDDDCGIPVEGNSATFLENMMVGDKIYCFVVPVGHGWDRIW